MITRRRFLERTGLLAAGISVSKLPSPASTADTLDPDKLTPYVDPLPIPQIAQPSGMRPSPEDPSLQLPYYRMAMRAIECKVHRDLPATRMWGFGSSSPGPTFEARSNHGVIVEWVNELPQRHFLPIDHTLHGAEANLPAGAQRDSPAWRQERPRTATATPSTGMSRASPPPYHYPNRQDAAMLFYHDHTMGINRLNIYAGLQGMYFIRDQAEDALKLPQGKYEIPLLVYDRFLLPDGQLEYPVSPKPEAPWVPEVFGNAILVNGKLFPYLEVEPRKYRFRLMNGSNGALLPLFAGQATPLPADRHRTRFSARARRGPAGGDGSGGAG